MQWRSPRQLSGKQTFYSQNSQLISKSPEDELAPRLRLVSDLCSNFSEGPKKHLCDGSHDINTVHH